MEREGNLGIGIILKWDRAGGHEAWEWEALEGYSEI